VIVGSNRIKIESQLLICGLVSWKIEVEVFEAISYLSSYCVTRLFVGTTSLPSCSSSRYLNSLESIAFRNAITLSAALVSIQVLSHIRGAWEVRERASARRTLVGSPPFPPPAVKISMLYLGIKIIF
jgi:hypothetical protein